jgi:thiamine-phosphate pyrophosphorylase
MHNNLPKIFIYLDHYNSDDFSYNNINLGVIYRNYNSVDRAIELVKISEACKRKKYQLYVSNDIKLALKHKANGIYIPSFNKSKKFENFENKKLTILGSAHSQKEIYEKNLQGCKIIFLSPVFPIKKKNTYLGLHKFNFLTYSNNVNIYALGGISKKNINKLKNFNIKGFGGISFFKKKPALFTGPVYQRIKFF